MNEMSVLAPPDQGIVDRHAVGVARLVAREQRADDGLGAGRKGKHRMPGQPRVDQSAQSLHFGERATQPVVNAGTLY
mgnify:CR=1 FL=1